MRLKKRKEEFKKKQKKIPYIQPYYNKCPITHQYISLKKSYLVWVPPKESKSTAIIYYIRDQYTLENLISCPLTNTKEKYKACRLSTLNTQQRNYLTVTNKPPHYLYENRRSNITEKRNNRCKNLISFPWESRHFAASSSPKKISSSAIVSINKKHLKKTYSRFFLLLFTLFAAFTLVIALFSLNPAMMIFFVISLIAFMTSVMPAEGALIAVANDKNTNARLKNHSTYKNITLQQTVSFIRQLLHNLNPQSKSNLNGRLEAVDTALRFINAVCRAYNSFLRKHPRLQTTCKWLSTGLWNNVSQSSKVLFALLRNYPPSEITKLQAILSYICTDTNQGKTLFTTIITIQQQQFNNNEKKTPQPKHVLSYGQKA